MTIDEQKHRIADLEAMIDVAIGYIKSGTPGLAYVVLVGSRAAGFQALQDAERKLLAPVLAEPQAEVWPCPQCCGYYQHDPACPLHSRNLTKL